MAGIIQRVFGPKTKKAATPPESLAEAEAALERHAREKSAAEEEILALDRERKALLLDDRSDDEIREIAQKRSDIGLRQERLAVIYPQLLARLSDAREALKESKWQDIAGRFFPVAWEYIGAMRKARERFDAMEALRDEARQAGLSTEVAHMMTRGPLQLNSDAFPIFEKMLAAAEAAAKPASDLPVSKPAKQEPPPATVRVKYLRAPVTLPNGKPRPGAWVGATGVLPVEQAEEYVRAGSAVYVGAPPVKVVPNPAAFTLVATAPAPDAVDPAKAEIATVEQPAPEAPKTKIDRAAWHAQTMLSEKE